MPRRVMHREAEGRERSNYRPLLPQTMPEAKATRNIIQRWLGLATISIQTASGSSSPEVNVEGILTMYARDPSTGKELKTTVRVTSA